mmetsp:Transcript_25893/g.76562  ORF Transcript_25893/g.76562 Transcript_25893/m.76562 type:complete len:234 (+) Transcript_25893:891-1592(+)
MLRDSDAQQELRTLVREVVAVVLEQRVRVGGEARRANLVAILVEHLVGGDAPKFAEALRGSPRLSEIARRQRRRGSPRLSEIASRASTNLARQAGAAQLESLVDRQARMRGKGAERLPLHASREVVLAPKHADPRVRYDLHVDAEQNLRHAARRAARQVVHVEHHRLACPVTGGSSRRHSRRHRRGGGSDHRGGGSDRGGRCCGRRSRSRSRGEGEGESASGVAESDRVHSRR